MEPSAFRDTLIVDVGLIGVLLLVGVWLRARSRLFQWLLLPAPVIAGFLGLLLGPHVLGALLASHDVHVGSWRVTGLPFSEYVGSYTTILIAVVFASMALSQEVGSTRLSPAVRGFTGYGILMSAGQVVVGMLLVLLVLGPMLGAPGSMGLILFAAWSGGFGTSAAMGDVFAANGQNEVTSVAFTAATVGMLAGIVGGVVLARIGASRGHTRAYGSLAGLPRSLRTGVLGADERRPVGAHTVSGSSMESLGLHIALIASIVAVGHLIQTSSAAWLNDFALPLFATSFLVGLLARAVMRRCGALRVVDRETMRSVSGTASDLLIVCGIVSIEPRFVAQHLESLLAIFLLGLVFCLVLGLVVAPRWLGEGWFEKQIFTWGWATGSVATGIALLRIVDPDRESSTIEDFGVAYLPLIPIEGAAVAIAPLLIITGYSWAVAVVWGVIALAGCWMLLRSARPRAAVPVR